jgi:hypothetical protein
MVIAKGEPWGEEVARPANLVVAVSDAELAAFVTAVPGEYGVSGGDLYELLGRPQPTESARRLLVDLLRVTTDRGEHGAVAHVVAHHRWWRGRIVGAFNVGRVGRFDVVPSAHPNDGRFETLEVAASMPWRQRLAARRRLPTGAHLPHPSISVRHVRHAAWTFARPVRCIIDGVEHDTITTLEVRIEPDAFGVIV